MVEVHDAGDRARAEPGHALRDRVVPGAVVPRHAEPRSLVVDRRSGRPASSAAGAVEIAVAVEIREPARRTAHVDRVGAERAGSRPPQDAAVGRIRRAEAERDDVQVAVAVDVADVVAQVGPGGPADEGVQDRLLDQASLDGVNDVSALQEVRDPVAGELGRDQATLARVMRRVFRDELEVLIRPVEPVDLELDQAVDGEVELPVEIEVRKGEPLERQARVPRGEERGGIRPVGQIDAVIEHRAEHEVLLPVRVQVPDFEQIAGIGLLRLVVRHEAEGELPRGSHELAGTVVDPTAEPGRGIGPVAFRDLPPARGVGPPVAVEVERPDHPLSLARDDEWGVEERLLPLGGGNGGEEDQGDGRVAQFHGILRTM